MKLVNQWLWTINCPLGSIHILFQEHHERLDYEITLITIAQKFQIKTPSHMYVFHKLKGHFLVEHFSNSLKTIYVYKVSCVYGIRLLHIFEIPRFLIEKSSTSIKNLGVRSKNPLFQITNSEILRFCIFNFKY